MYISGLWWDFRFLRRRLWRWLIFWGVALFSLVEVFRRYRSSCWLPYQGQGVTLSDRFLYLKPIPRVRLTHGPDDGGSKYLWNVGKLLPDCTAQHPRRQSSSSGQWSIASYCRLISDVIYNKMYIIHVCLCISTDIVENVYGVDYLRMSFQSSSYVGWVLSYFTTLDPVQWLYGI
jgi:hypothetical protein